MDDDRIGNSQTSRPWAPKPQAGVEVLVVSRRRDGRREAAKLGEALPLQH